ncbi:MAG: hypothetical protein U0869_23785 [Chloroflexota bacterium]
MGRRALLRAGGRATLGLLAAGAVPAVAGVGFGAPTAEAAAPTGGRVFADLEDDPHRWSWGYAEQGGVAAPARLVRKPSRSHGALRLGLKGGPGSYPNVRYQTSVGPAAWAHGFQLSAWFWFDPQQVGWDSTIQALEIGFARWHADRLWVWEAQLRFVSVLPYAQPSWHVWGGDQWVPAGMNQHVEGGRWHTLLLQGELHRDRARYVRLVCDEQAVMPGLEFAPTRRSPSGEAVSVAVQLDGNRAGDPYRVVIDQVTLLLTAEPPW